MSLNYLSTFKGSLHYRDRSRFEEIKMMLEAASQAGVSVKIVGEVTENNPPKITVERVRLGSYSA